MKTTASRIRTLFILCLSGLVGLSVFRCHTTVTKTPEQALLEKIDSAKQYLNINDTVKYVGAKTCMLCHQSIYNSFVHTGMGESIDIASKAKSSAKFGPHEVVYDSAKDFYYHPFWKNDSLYVLEYRLENKPKKHHGKKTDTEHNDTIYQRVQQINYIIGSGQHTNSNIYNINGYLFQAPITFYTQLGIWDLAPGFSDGFNSRFSREVGLECMNCHNSYPKFVQGSTNKFTYVPSGISCERCHGAGEMHVRAIQLGHKVDTNKAIDYTIVNPAKLPMELQVDVCQRCHLQGNAVLKPGKSFYDFHPGTKLSDVEDVFMPKYEGMENEYIMASHIARLKMSRCFIESQPQTPKGAMSELGSNAIQSHKGLTCITCHNPHVDVRSVSENTFNAQCQNCHSTAHNPCTEKKEVRDEVGDNCVSCHMPKGNTIDIPHVVTTDHYIRVVKPVANEDEIKKFITLYDVNNPNPSPETRGRAFIQQYASFQSDRPLLLDSAKHYFPDSTTHDIKKNLASLIEISFYEQDYQKILYYINVYNPKTLLDSLLSHKDYSNADAWTAYRIGEAFYNTNDMEKAYLCYKKATQLAPFVLEFQNKLGVALMALNSPAEAEKVYNYILAQNPEFVPALTNRGFIELKKGHADTALACYNKALALSPDDHQALTNIIGYYLLKDEGEKAKDYLKRFVKLYPKEDWAKKLNKMKIPRTTM